MQASSFFPVDKDSQPRTGLYSTRHGTNTTFSCPRCDRKFLLKYLLDYHLKQHTEGRFRPISKRKFKCEACGRSFLNAGALNRHQSCHKRNKSQTGSHCKTCGEYLEDDEALEEHIRLHAVERSLADDLECRVCKRQFSHRYSLQLHRCIFPPKEPPPFLQPHELRAMATCPFGCGMCGQAFPSTSLLAQHRLWHRKRTSHAVEENEASERKSEDEEEQHPFVCDYCGGSFQLREDLDEHLECHEEVRAKVMCVVCGTVFYDGGALDRHMQSHHEDLNDEKCRLDDENEVSVVESQDVDNIKTKLRLFSS